MTGTIYICEVCREQLGADDRVVDAAEQLEVTTMDSVGREYIDGGHVLIHGAHWGGNSRHLKERARGRLDSFVQPS